MGQVVLGRVRDAGSGAEEPLPRTVSFSPSTWVVDDDDGERRRRRSWHVAPHYRAYLLQKRPRLMVLAARRHRETEDPAPGRRFSLYASSRRLQCLHPAPAIWRTRSIRRCNLPDRNAAACCPSRGTRMQSAVQFSSLVGASAQQIRLRKRGYCFKRCRVGRTPYQLHNGEFSMCNVQWSDAYTTSGPVRVILDLSGSRRVYVPVLQPQLKDRGRAASLHSQMCASSGD